MKRRLRKQLIISFAVLIVALAVFFSLVYHNSHRINSPAERVDLVNLTDLAQLTFPGNDGTELSFHKSEGTWFFTPDPALSLDQEKFHHLEDLLAGLYVVRTFDQPDNLSAYGLEPAATWITAVTSAQESTTVLLGNEVSGSSVYAAVVGSGTVSVVSNALFKAIDTDLTGLLYTPADTQQ